MIPPGPPHLAGRRGGGRQRPSFDSLLFWGAGRARKALPYRMAAEAERLGIPRSGRHLSVSVSFGPAHAGRLRPGFAGPSCQRKGFQDMGTLYVGFCVIRCLVAGKAYHTSGRFFVFKGEPCFSAPFSLLYAKGRHGTSTAIRKEHGENIADSGRGMDV